MTYAVVEAMINARPNRPPQSMLVSAGAGNAPPQESLCPHAENLVGIYEPAIERLTYEGREPMESDISTIEEQLARPPNAKYEDLVRRARMFAQSPTLGGWHPRPPPDSCRSSRTGPAAVVATSKSGSNIQVARAMR